MSTETPPWDESCGVGRPAPTAQTGRSVRLVSSTSRAICATSSSSLSNARSSRSRRQSSTTAQLAFPLDYLIEYVTFVMTLEPGDIISTGTPSGVSALVAGDVFTVKVEGVGELTNPVEDE